MTNKEKTELQKEIVNSLPLQPHGRLLLAPRSGKSKIAIDTIKINKPKSILWVTPLAKLAEVDIPGEFETWKAKAYLKKLTTVTWTSLNKIEGHYDIIILDEEQFITDNNIKNFLNGKVTYKYILSMTGTKTKHKDKQELYDLLSLPILYELSINKAVNIGLLANYSIKVIEVDLGKENNVKAGTKDKPFFTSEENNYRWLHNTAQKAIFQKRKDVQFRILARMRAIYNSISKTQAAKYLFDNLDGRKMFFCASIDQAEFLTNYTYHSKTSDKYLNEFMKGDLDEIAMVNAGGVGTTFKEVDHLVMVQADSDKNGLTSQKIARTLLQQKDYKATIWIICLVGTQDESWVESALSNFDKSKVEFIRFKNFNL